MINKELKGLLGGIGAYASSYIYEKTLDYTRPKRHDKDYPNLLIYNLTCNHLDKSNFDNEEALLEINHGIKTLTLAGCERIWIGCNSVHSFLNKLDNGKIVNWPKQFINSSQTDKIMLLCSQHTRDTDFYSNLVDKNQTLFYPTQKEQEELNEMILAAIQNKITKSDINNFQRILSKYNKMTIAICCTELSIIYLKLNHKYPNIIDSCDYIAKELSQ